MAHKVWICLNPYSTGSNSNIAATTNINAQENTVLILILLEVTQILLQQQISMRKKIPS